MKYLKNYDADTITVEIPGVHPLIGHHISVRVLGIDAAEMKGHGACEHDRALAAQQLVEKVLTNSKRIDLKNVQRDKYFRILAEIEVDGKSLQQLLLEEKLVVSYDGGHKNKVDWCKMGLKAPTKAKTP